MFAGELWCARARCSSEPPPAQERQEIIDNLLEAGFPADGITISDGEVVVGGDIHVTLEASRERSEPADPGPEHARTANLVSGRAGLYQRHGRSCRRC